jgi:hypothetical protein
MSYWDTILEFLPNLYNKLAKNKQPDLVKEEKSKDITPKKKPEVNDVLDDKFAEAIFQSESSGGTNKLNELNDAGKYGWAVGFTPRTYEDIKLKASQGDKRYIELYKKIDLDTSIESAKKSALEYAKFRNIVWGKDAKPTGEYWYEDPVDIYNHRYSSSSPEVKKNFQNNYKK